jgi:hypothetical protein
MSPLEKSNSYVVIFCVREIHDASTLCKSSTLVIIGPARHRTSVQANGEITVPLHAMASYGPIDVGARLINLVRPPRSPMVTVTS